MVRKRRDKVRPDAVYRVVIEPEIHRALLRLRADTGLPIQRSASDILRGHLEKKGLLEREPAAAAS